MKKSLCLVAASLLSIIFFGCHSAHIRSPQSSEPRSLASQSTGPSHGYCIALRGNGELQPAHWGALARTVEQLGLPQSMAGGSSATVSMFLMEAIASNPLIQNQSTVIQKERASLLLKSFLGFFTELQETKAWSDLKAVYGQYQKLQHVDQIEKVGILIHQSQYKAALSSLGKAIDLGAVDLKSAEPLITALQKADTKKAQFYWQQILETAKVFGKFDAAKDDNLFFRAGIVNFERAAVTFGKVAAFYSFADKDAAQEKRWGKFFEICSPNSQGKTWIEILVQRPECGSQFHALFQAHFQKPNTNVHPEDQEIGKHIAMYPTTTVLTSSAVTDFREAMNQYHAKLDTHFGKNFKISNPDDVRFGYWGSVEKLQQISQSLDSTDEKSRRFLPLGPTTWKTVLSLSPAEPGLSPLKEFTAQGQKYISAGGWSDLHPVLVLKAAGCDQVVYLTRQGGESLFAQGVAKRLLNLERDWSLLQPQDEKSKRLNDEGDRLDLTSTWARLYNLGNPSSSVNRSLSGASAVLCTNWNSFEVQKDFVPLIEESYRSSFWINPEINSPLISSLSPVLKIKKPGCSP